MGGRLNEVLVLSSTCPPPEAEDKNPRCVSSGAQLSPGMILPYPSTGLVQGFLGSSQGRL